MTYLDPVNDSGKKIKPPKPVKQPKEKKDPADRKPVFKNRGTLFIILGGVLVVVVAAVIAAILTVNAVNTQHAKDQKAAATQDKKVAQSTLVADVQKTTENIKTYLKKNPKASIDQMIANSNTVNRRIDKGETILIANASSDAKKAYTNWVVVGTDRALNKNSNYQYQSYSNTFRWMNNKTGASSNIVEDKTARNVGALGAS